MELDLEVINSEIEINFTKPIESPRLVLVPLEIYLGGRWQKAERAITRTQLELLKDDQIHLFPGDDTEEIFVRLACE
jgi:hypothetical protein